METKELKNQIGGAASYAIAINALNWLLANNKATHDIRVLNQSFGAKLWQPGVVVVASACNFGSGPQSEAVTVSTAIPKSHADASASIGKNGSANFCGDPRNTNRH